MSTCAWSAAVLAAAEAKAAADAAAVADAEAATEEAEADAVDDPPPPPARELSVRMEIPPGESGGEVPRMDTYSSVSHTEDPWRMKLPALASLPARRWCRGVTASRRATSDIVGGTPAVTVVPPAAAVSSWLAAAESYEEVISTELRPSSARLAPTPRNAAKCAGERYVLDI